MKCILCEKNATSRYLCDSHYKMCIDYINIYEKWNTIDLKNYYHNLKHKMYKINRMNIIVPNCAKMIALSYLLSLKDKNMKYIEKCIYDIKKLLIFKNKIYTDDIALKDKIMTNDFEIVDFRLKWEASYVCEDGHKVRSIMELMFDNWLYNHGITHSYEKKVNFIADHNKLMFCDFYLNTFDVYVELWGKYDEQYVKRRQVKKAIYEANGIKLLEFESEDLKRLDDIFFIKLNEIK